ncbi:hypothetical protein B0H15DRAFT_159098 [Mycena belliarum]|uniref:Peptidase M20 dimerisation domain-containing protein n=1 Tax=Mycena belliarum TaxID=1033014 RepID=A0AAD6UD83_9AGAR|nr:hypothetical protein B0H15DRAFT_159098 [Mycena belliae]
MDVKHTTELPGGAPRARRARWPRAIACAGVVLAAFLLLSSGRVRLGCSSRHASKPSADAASCPQANPLVPKATGALWSELAALHTTPAFLARAVAQLSAAVKIPTETFDDMGPVGEDARWASHAPFVEHLAQAFPLVHQKLALQKVNTYGLIYTWQGSDATLKPLLLMGHYDVVPVAPLSVDQWTYPPYSGHFDGESVWGRGSSDDKSGVIGILTSIEVLLEKNFAPTRTVVLSFGFDEEVGGYQGAGYLGPALLERFGPDSFAMVVDEGSGYTDAFGAVFASPGIAEKGYVNVNVEVQTPGGHSSVPPAHTSIGILAAMIVHLEAHAPVPVLALGTPAFEMATCFGAHGPEMPHHLKRAISRAGKSEKARRRAEEMLLEDRMFRAVVGTTQAVDIVHGGVKSNALPEQAVAVVNHRIATQSSVNATITRDTELLLGLAARFNLSVSAYGQQLTPAEGAYGSLTLSTPLTLEPAPITPSDAAPFRLLAGTIRTAFQTARNGTQDVVVAPGMMTGNTDTRFNWALSQHIFRYGHDNQIGGNLHGIHTVNEHMSASNFVEMIIFFTTLILNADEAAL